MTTKLGMVVTYLRRLVPIKSYNSWVTCSYRITWQTILSAVSMAIKLDSMATYLTLWSSGFARSYDKLKPLYLHYHNAHGHQTWQGGGLPWGLPQLYITLWLYGLSRSYGKLKPLSPLPECLWPPNMVGWRLALMSFYP